MSHPAGNFAADNLNNVAAARLVSLKCLGYYGNYAAYFKDDFCIHLIDNTNSRQCENFLDYLFSYASFNSIKYLLETKGNDLCDVRIFDSMFNSKTLFSYACRRNLEELIVYLIDKKVNLLNIDSDGNSAAHLICKYSTPEMLKYLLQNTNIIFGKNFSMCGPDFYMENNYLMQNFIVQNNFQYTNLDTIKLLMKW